MVKAVFYLKGKNAQHEGNRLLMASKMIEHGFEKGAVFNLPDGRVEVLMEGPKEKIVQFHSMASRDFESWVKAKAKDHKTVKEQIGNPGVKFTSPEFDDDLLVHKLEIYGHSLTFDQIYKGVDVYKDLKEQMRENSGVYKDLKTQMKENSGVYKDLKTQMKENSGINKDLRRAIHKLNESQDKFHGIHEKNTQVLEELLIELRN
ncbi:MAG: hypothetical protein GF334_05885 [Candidatus Altiarchaeales archaeon]|nr:hypothetical protein [Candidatus Altiarchaeales archaeon]